MHEYDQIAEWYVAMRDPDVGIPDVADVARRLSPGAPVLDLGCGDGIPISRFLTCDGSDVVALDSSPEMIGRYRAHFPDAPTRCTRAEEADFPAESFEAVVPWGVLFHLPEAKQRVVIRKVASWLKPGGLLLFTSAEVEGATEGEMNRVAFQYTSLGVAGYRDVIENAGMRLQTSHHDTWDNFVYVAEKTA